MEKNIARIVSYALHPLIMTSIGMLVLFHSGTSLSVLQPEVKRIAMIITVLFTFLFPASMIIMLYLTKVISNIELQERKERILPMSLAIIMYMFTFFIMKGIPQLTGGHIVFLFCPPAALFISLMINNFLKPSIHMLGIGILTGIVMILIVFYRAPLQGLFILVVLASGILGTSRLILELHKPLEVLAGYSSGLLITLLVMTIYIV